MALQLAPDGVADLGLGQARPVRRLRPDLLVGPVLVAGQEAGDADIRVLAGQDDERADRATRRPGGTAVVILEPVVD